MSSSMNFSYKVNIKKSQKKCYQKYQKNVLAVVEQKTSQIIIVYIEIYTQIHSNIKFNKVKVTLKIISKKKKILIENATPYIV